MVHVMWVYHHCELWRQFLRDGNKIVPFKNSKIYLLLLKFSLNL